MTTKDRLEIIRGLLQERDKCINPDGEIEDYSKHDEALFKLNDGGHIDWLYKFALRFSEKVNKWS